MGAIASQITSLTLVYSTVYSDADQRKHQLRVTGLYVRNSSGTGEFPAQMASNAENVSIWWRHHDEAWRIWTGMALRRNKIHTKTGIVDVHISYNVLDKQHCHRKAILGATICIVVSGLCDSYEELDFIYGRML